VKDINAEVERVERTSLGVAISYRSPTRSWLTVTRVPRAVQIDGRQVELALTRSANDWLLAVPGGQHAVEIQDATEVSFAVDVASVFSSRSIVWLGSRFVLLVVGLYVSVRIRRGLRHLGRIKSSRPERRFAIGGRSTVPLQHAGSEARE